MSRLSARPLFVGWTAGAEPEIIWELVLYIRLSTEANLNRAEVWRSQANLNWGAAAI